MASWRLTLAHSMISHRGLRCLKVTMAAIRCGTMSPPCDLASRGSHRAHCPSLLTEQPENRWTRSCGTGLTWVDELWSKLHDFMFYFLHGPALVAFIRPTHPILTRSWLHGIVFSQIFGFIACSLRPDELAVAAVESRKLGFRCNVNILHLFSWQFKIYFSFWELMRDDEPVKWIFFFFRSSWW